MRPSAFNKWLGIYAFARSGIYRCEAKLVKNKFPSESSGDPKSRSKYCESDKQITVGNRKGIDLPLGEMYCLQCLIPVLLIPKPTNPALMQTHVMFIVLYLIGFFLERKPCTICSLVFLAAVFLICNSGVGNCLFWGNCEGHTCDNG